MSNLLPDHVQAAIEDACREAGAELIALEVRGQLKQLLLEVAIDSVEGIRHEHCKAVSKAIESRLVDDEWYGRLRAVDVSSPGADAPVKYLWQLKKHVGRDVRCVKKDGSIVEGALASADDAGLVLVTKPGSQQVTITSDAIHEANVILKF
ncbi:MAG: hypothetical protein SGJ05_05405 [bacterium]|nr:hypothetical protein [bacterium]